LAPFIDIESFIQMIYLAWVSWNYDNFKKIFFFN